MNSDYQFKCFLTLYPELSLNLARILCKPEPPSFNFKYKEVVLLYFSTIQYFDDYLINYFNNSSFLTTAMKICLFNDESEKISNEEISMNFDSLCRDLPKDKGIRKVLLETISDINSIEVLTINKVPNDYRKLVTNEDPIGISGISLMEFEALGQGKPFSGLIRIYK